MNTESVATNNYDKLERWGRELDAANQRRIKETLALIPSEVRTILDAGCGDGCITNILSNMGLQVTGIDISHAVLKFVNSRKVQAGIGALPFPNHSFDLVLCAQVLEHLPHDIYSKALAEIMRVADKYILVSTPNEEYLPASFTRCEDCGYIFHINYHARAYNMDSHRDLFTPFERQKTIEVEKWQQNRLLTNIQHNLGIYRFETGIACPLCGHPAKKPPMISRERWLVWRVIQKTSRFLPNTPKARWICSIYMNKNAV